MADGIGAGAAPCQIKMIDDSRPTQTAQADLGPRLPTGAPEIHDGAFVLNPYGVTSVPPDGSSAVVVFLDADRTLCVITGVNYKNGRPTGLQPGEAALFNGVKKTILKMDADGKAHLNCDFNADGVITSAKDVTAQGGVSASKDVTAKGKVAGATVEAGNGASGTFVSKEGRTVTVTKGIVTSIV